MMAPAAPLLSVTDARHRFGEVRALDGVSLSVAPGECVGLVFQITDDILDVEGDTATLGKPQGSDQKHAKPTYPALLGLERARALAREQHAAALESLRPLEDNGRLLGEIADFIVDRTH